MNFGMEKQSIQHSEPTGFVSVWTVAIADTNKGRKT